MTTIYDAAILLVDDNPDLLTLVTDNRPPIYGPCLSYYDSPPPTMARPQN